MDIWWQSFQSAHVAFAQLAPILLAGILFLVFMVSLFIPPSFGGIFGVMPHKRAQRESRRTVRFRLLLAYGAMFGVLGAAVGFLFSISAPSSFESFLPHIVIVATILFQLLGRLKRDWVPPIKSATTLVGASVATFVFLFTVMYFQNSGYRVLYLADFVKISSDSKGDAASKP